MKTIRRFIPLIALLLALTFSVNAAAAGAEAESGADRARRLQTLSDLIVSLSMDNESDNPLLDALAALLDTNPALFDQLAESMFSQLDAYSGYYTREIYDKAFPQSEAYVGVGLVVNPNVKKGLFVADVLTGGPADTAGLLPGDHIMTVGGKDISSLPYTEVTSLLRGEANTQVTVTVLRDASEKPLTFKMTRRGLRASNIAFKNLGNRVAYISISRFNDIYDYFEFTNIYKNLPYDGYRSVIIDLRGNPGGSLDVVYNIINSIVPKKNEILFALSTGNLKLDYYRSTGMAQWQPNKLLILVDENSASASELMAGSLRDLGYAELVGVKTYGKGRGQAHVDMGSGGVAVITTLNILLPGVLEYDGIGLTPTHNVPLEQRPRSELTALAPVDAVRALLPDASGDRVLGVEERLRLAGYFVASPDSKQTSTTRWALNAFASDSGLSDKLYGSRALLQKLAQETDRLLAEPVWFDTQLEAAQKLAVEAAKQPLNGTLPPRSFEEEATGVVIADPDAGVWRHGSATPSDDTLMG